jgi:acid phosphatase (class A)
MSNRLTRLLTALFRHSFLALLLTAGLFSASRAEENFYYLRPVASVLVPEASAPAAVTRVASYLTTAQEAITDFPPPPAAGSSADKADLAAVLQWQKDRTPEQCSEAMAQSDQSFVSFFGDVSPFAKPLPAAVGAFFKRVSDDSGNANRYIKKIYQRDRPFLRSSELKPCLGRAQGFSYPSGHATDSHLFGLILSDLLPRQGAIFMRNADQAALNRVIGGVHHPSDVEAGKRLGDRLYRELLKNPAFTADMQGLRQYLR